MAKPSQSKKRRRYFFKEVAKLRMQIKEKRKQIAKLRGKIVAKKAGSIVTLANEKLAQLTQELEIAVQSLEKLEWRGPLTGLSFETPWYAFDCISRQQNGLACSIEAVKRRIKQEKQKLSGLDHNGNPDLESEGFEIRQRIQVLIAEQKELEKQLMKVHLDGKLAKEKAKILELTKLTKLRLAESIEVMTSELVHQDSKRSCDCETSMSSNLFAIPSRMNTALNFVYLNYARHQEKNAGEVAFAMYSRSSKILALARNFRIEFSEDPELAEMAYTKLETLSEFLMKESAEISKLVQILFKKRSAALLEAFEAKVVEREFSALERVRSLTIKRDKETLLKVENVSSKAKDALDKFDSIVETFIECKSSAAFMPIQHTDIVSENLSQFVSFSEEIRLDLIMLGSYATQESSQLKELELTLSDMFNRGLEIYELLGDVLNEACSNTLKRLDGTAGEAISKETCQQAESLLITFLRLQDSMLAHEVWRREDIQYMQKVVLRPSTAPTNGEVSNTRIEQLDRFERDISTLEKYKSIYWNLADSLKRRMVISGILVPYEDKVVSFYADSKLSGLTETESVDLSKFFSEINSPLERVTKLLNEFEEHFAFRAGTEIITENLSADLEVGRKKCKQIIAELFEADRFLREVFNLFVQSELNKLELWQRRVLVAERIGDKYLAERARKRKEVYERVVAFLDSSSSENCDLPSIFEQARVTVERVEKKLGLQPNELLNKDRTAFALSLFDRIYFLLENLYLLLEADSSSSKDSLGLEMD